MGDEGPYIGISIMITHSGFLGGSGVFWEGARNDKQLKLHASKPATRKNWRLAARKRFKAHPGKPQGFRKVYLRMSSVESVQFQRVYGGILRFRVGAFQLWFVEFSGSVLLGDGLSDDIVHPAPSSERKCWRQTALVRSCSTTDIQHPDPKLRLCLNCLGSKNLRASKAVRLSI